MTSRAWYTMSPRSTSTSPRPLHLHSRRLRIRPNFSEIGSISSINACYAMSPSRTHILKSREHRRCNDQLQILQPRSKPTNLHPLLISWDGVAHLTFCLAFLQ